MRGRRPWCLGGLVPVVMATLAASAPGPAAAALTPVTDCRVPAATEGVYRVYYGYANDGPQTTIDFGDDNQVVPGLGFQGQPTVFNEGSYPRVFSAVFNSNAFTAIAWSLAGTDAVATLGTPMCAAGATGPAGGVSRDAATLSGIVNPEGARRTDYRFEYGPTIAYGKTTPVRQLAGVAEGELVTEPIGGLTPGTTYHYRLVAAAGVGTGQLIETAGEDRTFTTLESPAPPPAAGDLVVTRSGPRRARVGRAVKIVLTVRNEGAGAATGVGLAVRAPRGLRLVGLRTASGRCSGLRTRECPLGTIPRGSTASATMRIAPKRAGAFEYSAIATADQPEANVRDNLLIGGLRVRR